MLKAIFSKRTLAVLLSVFLVFSLAACGSKDEKPAGTKTDDTTDKLLLLIPGNLGDKSFFDSAESGFKELKDTYGDKIELKITELGREDSAYLPAMEEATEEDWDIIISIGWQMIESIHEVAPKYPDKKFVICDTTVGYDEYDLGNVLSITYKANEGSYLAGIVGGSLTETNQLGFIGGEDTPLIKDFLVGYIEGVKLVNPEAVITDVYVGNYVDSARAKELANTQFDSGVDVGFQVAGGAGIGQIEAAAEHGKLVLGVDSDQALVLESTNPELAEVIPTSMLKNVGASLVKLYEDYKADNVEWGGILSLGLKENAVGLAKNKYYEQLVPAEVRTMVDEYEEKIASGEIKVQDAYSLSPEELQKFIDDAK